MTFAAFSFEDTPISYDGSWRAECVQQPIHELDRSKVKFIIGSLDFSDDATVHADHWECHPSGDEILYVIEGRLAAVIQRDGTAEESVIEKGQAFIVPRSCWHRLRVIEPGRLVFFTPTEGIEHRPHASEGGDGLD